MYKLSKKEVQNVEKYYAPLKGGTIVDIKLVPDDDDDYWITIILEMPPDAQGRSRIVPCLVSRDPEGNGPGHLEIEDINFAEDLPDDMIHVTGQPIPSNDGFIPEINYK